MSDSQPVHAETLDAFRRENFAWLLIRLMRDFQLRIVAEIGEQDRDGRLAHAMVLAHLPLEGGRLTDLAAAAGVTKQSMGSLVDDMERFGYVARVPDPHDGRAKRICFTKAGMRLLETSREAVARIRNLYAETIGERRFVTLHNSLAALLDGLDALSEGLPPQTPK